MRSVEFWPEVEVARTIKRHSHGLLTWFHHRITNALSEPLNSRIQTLKNPAGGFHHFSSFRTRIRFFLGGLDLKPRSLQLARKMTLGCRVLRSGRQEKVGMDRGSERDEGVDDLLRLRRKQQAGKGVIGEVGQPLPSLKEENDRTVELRIGTVIGPHEEGTLFHIGEIHIQKNFDRFPGSGKGKEELSVRKNVCESFDGKDFRAIFAPTPALALSAACGRIEEFDLDGVAETLNGRPGVEPGLQPVPELKLIRIAGCRSPAEPDRAVGLRFNSP